MKKTLLLIAIILLAGCSKPSGINLIMETDIGNDVDDALAMDLLYKYHEAGQINLLGVCVNKEGSAPGEFVDILNTWYGHPDIPIGIIRKGAFCENDGVNYAKAVVNLKDDNGKPLFARTLKEYDTLPEAVELYRKILSKAKDKSVTIASVGFSTNLARLLETGPDEYSKLDGKTLVEKKVKLLVTMAGQVSDPEYHEYNIVRDIPAAQKVFSEWPTPIVTSPFDVGCAVKYPATSIENDFAWAGPHPMIEAYKAYKQMPYDRETWDPTAVLYAVEGDKWFNVSEPGLIKVTDEGGTIFTPSNDGTRRYLTIDNAQADAIRKHFIEIITTPPANRK